MFLVFFYVLQLFEKKNKEKIKEPKKKSVKPRKDQQNTLELGKKSGNQ